MVCLLWKICGFDVDVYDYNRYFYYILRIQTRAMHGMDNSSLFSCCSASEVKIGLLQLLIDNVQFSRTINKWNMISKV